MRTKPTITSFEGTSFKDIKTSVNEVCISGGFAQNKDCIYVVPSIDFVYPAAFEGQPVEDRMRKQFVKAFAERPLVQVNRWGSERNPWW